MRTISDRNKRSKRTFLVAEIHTRQNRGSKSSAGRKNAIPVSFSLEKQKKLVSNSKKPLKTVTHGYFEALASLVLQNAICNGFYGFFSLENNFPCFSRKLNRKKAILCLFLFFKSIFWTFQVRFCGSPTPFDSKE